MNLKPGQTAAALINAAKVMILPVANQKQA